MDEKTYSGLLTDDGQDELTVQQTIDDACSLAVAIADDPAHGYSQANRWGPDYDCSSFLIHVWQAVGVPVRDAGASYTGNMKAAFLRCGFADVSALVNLVTGAGCEAGDILLNERDHVAMSLGNGLMVWASSSGGHPEPGDQTGREIRTGAFYSFPWDCCLRYLGGGTVPAAQDPDELQDPTIYATVCLLPELRQGDHGYYVRLMQTLLALKGCAPSNSLTISGVYDGDFGPASVEAVNKFKKKIGLPADCVCDPQTFAELINK